MSFLLSPQMCFNLVILEDEFESLRLFHVEAGVVIMENIFHTQEEVGSICPPQVFNDPCSSKGVR